MAGYLGIFNSQLLQAEVSPEQEIPFSNLNVLILTPPGLSECAACILSEREWTIPR